MVRRKSDRKSIYDGDALIYLRLIHAWSLFGCNGGMVKMKMEFVWLQN